MLVIASSMSASVGCGFFASNADAAMICPDWQYPHCGTSTAAQAFCTGCELSRDSPSMVTILSVGLIALTGIEQERTTSPFRWTEQAPHCATPQPYLVPVRPTCSRMTHSSGVLSSTCTSCVLPLMLSFAMLSPFFLPYSILCEPRIRGHHLETALAPAAPTAMYMKFVKSTLDRSPAGGVLWGGLQVRPSSL